MAITIENPKEHFFTTLYEGNGAGQRVGKFVPFTDNGTIANSCIFNRTDNPRLAITPSSVGNSRTFTFSAWIKRVNLGSARNLLLTVANSGGTAGDFLMFHTDNTIKFTDASSSHYNLITNRTFEDTSKFYHLLISADTTQATASSRLKIYIDGEQITSFSTASYPTQNFEFAINYTSYPMNFGGDYGSSGSENAGYYLAEVNIVDGTALTPSTFGLTDTSTGRWIPKTLSGITYGTNGFRLKFQDSSALGDDTSGNGNDLTATNLSASDQTTDSPTQNFVTFDSNDSGNTGTTGGAGTIVLAEGNLRLTAGSTPSNWDIYRTSKPVASGKYYVEVTLTDLDGATYFGCISKNQNIQNTTNLFYDFLYGWSYATDNGKIETNNSGQLTYGSARSQGDVIGIAVDMDNGNLWFSENGTYPNSGNPATGANPAFTNLKIANQDGGLSFACQMGYSGAIDWNFGQKSYTHSAPTGFVALQQSNMPETSKGITGMAWAKSRDAVGQHVLRDSSRGLGTIFPSLTSAESQAPRGITKFLKGGYALGEDDLVGGANNAGESFVSWNFVANGGTTSSNSDGNVTCTLQVNDTAKFSIQTWTNTGAGTKTIGHGLGVKPGLVIQKRLDTTSNWFTYHHKLSGNGSYLHLNTTDSTQTGSDFANTEPTSSVFSSNASGSSSATFVSYCFAEVDGFSKFGVYEGNNNVDGTFCWLGFKPAFVMIKGIDGSSSSYPFAIYDNKRSPTNPVSLFLSANDSVVDNTLDRIDFLSNGFKLRQAYSYSNASETYVYVAFAESPFYTSTNPTTAR